MTNHKSHSILSLNYAEGSLSSVMDGQTDGQTNRQTVQQQHEITLEIALYAKLPVPEIVEQGRQREGDIRWMCSIAEPLFTVCGRF